MSDCFFVMLERQPGAEGSILKQPTEDASFGTGLAFQHDKKTI